FEHFLAVARALSSLDLWDERDGFFYDVLHLPEHGRTPLRVRSAVGFLPLIAAAVLEAGTLEHLPDFTSRMRWFLRHRPTEAANLFGLHKADGDHWLLSVVSPSRL